MNSQRGLGPLRDHRITNRAPSPSTPKSVGRGGQVFVTPPSSTSSTPNSQQHSSVNRRPQVRPSSVSTVSTQDLKSLIEKTNSIDTFIKELKEKGETSSSQSCRTRRLPRELSALVHDVYKNLKETDKDWNYEVNFDHVTNKDFNNTMRTNVNGLLTESSGSYTEREITRSLRVYFKSLKNRHQRESRGTQNAVTKSQRRRQRMFTKSTNRLKALKESTNIDEATKRKIEPVLSVNYMSSDESVLMSDDNDDVVSHKKFVKHVAMWRSAEFQNCVDSLDRKISRKKTARGKLMTVPVENGETSGRDAPMDCPDWACITLFD